MRNLKRALSLALATIMTMGLMVVGTGASYQDVKATDNVEAIEVLQAVGIMTGDENGDFNPDANVTRNEIAVVMSNLLNLDYDYYRGTNPFVDVPDWAAPYVAACAAEGVVAGVGNNMYGGSNNVTAAQAALMIMKALGYFQYQADFDTDWQIATIRQASYINLFDNINANAETALTRNQIAQLVLNGLKANMVTFTGTVGTEIKLPDGTTWNSGYVAEYTAVTNANKKYDSIDTGTSNIGKDDKFYVQLGEELYNGDLKLTDDTDVFGRPARYWEYDGKEIGTYVNTDLLVQEYTTKVTGDTLYNLLSRNTVEDYTFDIVIDGEYEAPSTSVSNVWFTKNAINRNNDATLGGTGNGVLTQVFVDNEEDVVTIAIINTFLAIADDDYNEKKDSAPFNVYGAAKSGDVYYKSLTTGDDQVSMTASAEDFDIEEVVEGDAFLVTVADGEIQTMAAPEMISGTEIDSFETGSNKGDNVDYSKSAPSTVEVDGTEYKFAHAAEYDYEVLDFYTSSTPGNTTVNLKDKTYNLFLDAYGYVIGVEEVEKSNNYLFITGIDLNSSNLKNQYADASAIFMDGTMKPIKVNMDKSTITSLNTLNVKANAILNRWFTYTVNNSEIYTVNEVVDGNNNAAANAKATIFQYNATIADDGNSTNGAEVIKIDDRNIAVNGKPAAAAVGSHGLQKVYGTDETVYITVSLAELNNDDISDKNYGIIGGVDSVATGIGNVSLTAWSTEDALTEAQDKNVANEVGTGMGSNGVYSLYNDDGDVIAAVVVGEDAGSAKNLVYVHSSSVFKETYDKTADQWTWSRKVVLNGEEVVLTEVGDGLSELGSMVQHTWYQVKFNADGNVISVEKANTALKGNEIVDSYLDIDTAVNDKDTVLYYSTNPPIYSENLSLTGRTLWLNTDATKGFRVAEDVNVVLIQTNNNTEKTYFESGVSSLKTIVKDLNDRHDGITEHDYVISAILEKGVATSVVIYDQKVAGHNCDPYQDPDWGTPTGDIKTVAFTADGSFRLVDGRNNNITSGTFKYELQKAGVGGYSVVKSGTVNASTDTFPATTGYFGATLTNAGAGSYRLVVDGIASDVILVP